MGLTINDEQQEGTYKVSVSAYKSGVYGKEGLIKVYKNQDCVNWIYESDEENYLMMNAVVTLHLQKDDEVKLYNKHDTSIGIISIILSPSLDIKSSFKTK